MTPECKRGCRRAVAVCAAILLPKCVICLSVHVVAATGLARVPELCGAGEPAAFPYGDAISVGAAVLALVGYFAARHRLVSGSTG